MGQLLEKWADRTIRDCRALEPDHQKKEAQATLGDDKNTGQRPEIPSTNEDELTTTEWD